MFEDSSMDAPNYFKEEEFNSPTYSWKDHTQKKIKMFIVSTTRFHGKRDYKKVMQEDPDSGVQEDIDICRMKHEYIVPNRRSENDIEYIVNKKQDEFIKILEDFEGDANLLDYDCFFFMFFTFSVEGKGKCDDSEKEVAEERLHFADGTLSIHKIWDTLKTIKTFHGKPKVFLIQSDNIKLLQPDQKEKAGPEYYEKRKIPVDADRLIIQSTIPGPGQFALHGQRATPTGSGKEATSSESFLIQAFLEEMKKNKERPSESQLDLLSLTTAMNANMKEKLEQFKTIDNNETVRLIVSSNTVRLNVSSTFTRLLYL